MFQKPFCVVEFQVFPPNPQGIHIIITVLTLFTFTIILGWGLLEAPGDFVTLLAKANNPKCQHKDMIACCSQFLREYVCIDHLNFRYS